MNKENMSVVTHEKKTIQPYYGRLLDGSKTYELRNNGDAYQPGDTFIAEEYDPETGAYTGAYIEYEIVGKDSLKELMAAFPDADCLLSIQRKSNLSAQRAAAVEELMPVVRAALEMVSPFTQGVSINTDGAKKLLKALKALPPDIINKAKGE